MKLDCPKCKETGINVKHKLVSDGVKIKMSICKKCGHKPTLEDFDKLMKFIKCN